MIDVPQAFAELTLRREGPGARTWLDRLPALVERLLAHWDCRPDGPVGHGGVAVVVPVTRSESAAVLKVSLPHPGNVGEAPALRLLEGRGAVRLLACDEPEFVLLIERAGPGTLDDVRPAAAVIEIAGELARRLAVPVPPEAGLTAVADTVDGWIAQLDDQLTRCPGAVPDDQVERARTTIGALADDVTPTLLHGDLHAGNILATGRPDGEPWLVIDPKGWTGPAAYDAFTVVAAHRDELAAAPDLGRELDDRINRFARTAAVEPELCRALVQARAVSSLLHQLLIPAGDWFDLELLRTAAALDGTRP